MQALFMIFLEHISSEYIKIIYLEHNDKNLDYIIVQVS